MRGQNEGGFIPHGHGQQLPELSFRGNVQPISRLVHDHERATAGQGRRQEYLFPLPKRQVTDLV